MVSLMYVPPYMKMPWAICALCSRVCVRSRIIYDFTYCMCFLTKNALGLCALLECVCTAAAYMVSFLCAGEKATGQHTPAFSYLIAIRIKGTEAVLSRIPH